MVNKKIVFFDIGNVLIKEVHPNLLNLIYSKIPENKMVARGIFDEKVKIILNDSFNGRLSLEETWSGLIDISGIEQNVFSEIKKVVENNEYNKELVRMIKEKIYPVAQVGLISDLSQIGYWVVRKNLVDLLNICNEKNIFISIFYGLTKIVNGDSFFDLIIQNVKCFPNEIIFIDDNKRLVDMACSKGINGILYLHEKKDESWFEANRILFQELKQYGLK